MGKFAEKFLTESVPQKRKFKVHAKDESGKDYTYDHESYSPKGIHNSERFQPSRPLGMGGLGHKLVAIKHNCKDVTNESEIVDEAKTDDNGETKAHAKAKEGSHEGVQHVRKRDDGSHYVSDWYSHDDTVASYYKGKRTDESFISESVAQYFTEKAEEFTSHRSDHTGVNYHADKENHNKILDMVHGDVADVELVHHDGANLHVKKYEAHKIHKSVHLHDEDGNHVDSFRHPHYR